MHNPSISQVQLAAFQKEHFNRVVSSQHIRNNQLSLAIQTTLQDAHIQYPPPRGPNPAPRPIPSNPAHPRGETARVLCNNTLPRRLLLLHLRLLRNGPRLLPSRFLRRGSRRDLSSGDVLLAVRVLWSRAWFLSFVSDDYRYHNIDAYAIYYDEYEYDQSTADKYGDCGGVESVWR